jgi:hypothetical protein
VIEGIYSMTEKWFDHEVWNDTKIRFPLCDRILCYGDGQVFIGEQKALRYISTDYRHQVDSEQPDIEQWIILPMPWGYPINPLRPLNSYVIPADKPTEREKLQD